MKWNRSRYAYEMPEWLVKFERRLLWARETPCKAPGRFDVQPSGVYIWHENLHGFNYPIYVGYSDLIWSRLYYHNHAPKRVGEFKDPSPVWRHMEARLGDCFKGCADFIPGEIDPLATDGCDCLPRYNVLIFVGATYDDEQRTIGRLMPSLNRAGVPSKSGLYGAGGRPL